MKNTIEHISNSQDFQARFEGLKKLEIDSMIKNKDFLKSSEDEFAELTKNYIDANTMIGNELFYKLEVIQAFLNRILFRCLEEYVI